MAVDQAWKEYVDNANVFVQLACSGRDECFELFKQGKISAQEMSDAANVAIATQMWLWSPTEEEAKIKMQRIIDGSKKNGYSPNVIIEKYMTPPEWWKPTVADLESGCLTLPK